MSYRDCVFTTVREEWNVYRLADGTEVRVKTVVKLIQQELTATGDPARTANGEPALQLQSQIVVVGVWPPTSGTTESGHVM